MVLNICPNKLEGLNVVVTNFLCLFARLHVTEDLQSCQASCSPVTALSHVEKFPAFMETEGSLLCSELPLLNPILSQFNPVHISTP
jgi:hypothetical protein